MKEILELEEGIEICGDAQNLTEAQELIFKCQPDIAILDISIEGDQGGLTFMEVPLDLSCQRSLLSFPLMMKAAYAQKSLARGAKGYVSKDKAVQCLASAIRDVHAGKQFISSS